MTTEKRDEATQPVSDTYRLLGNQRRLLTITYLSLFDCGTTVDVRQIARIIRAVELERPPREISTSEYESAYNSLIQVHLPKLATKGILEYDADRKTVMVTRKTSYHACLVAIGRMFSSGLLESVN
ncbi:DUF7344 domain-containing protein [Natronosalvus rutilus]|uniref:DUF7344 domain-containing protein n=1 Tax=Natronosalvus rutilus TaxID=2953753 RepID=UPI003CCC90C6